MSVTNQSLRTLWTFVHMEISGCPLRKHKLLADVTDIFNLENFQPPKNLIFLESLNILANVRYVLPSGGHFKTQSVDDGIYISVNGSVCHVVYTQFSYPHKKVPFHNESYQTILTILVCMLIFHSNRLTDKGLFFLGLQLTGATRISLKI